MGRRKEMFWQRDSLERTMGITENELTKYNLRSFTGRFLEDMILNSLPVDEE